MVLNKREMKKEIGVTRTKGVQRDSSVLEISDGSGASPEQSRMETGLLCTGHENTPGERSWGVHMRASLFWCSTTITLAMEMVECVT